VLSQRAGAIPIFCHNNRLMTIRRADMPKGDRWGSVNETASQLGVAVDKLLEGTP
jgi:hypothetical protein